MLQIARDAQKIYNHRTTTVPLSLLETTAARWRAIGREACLCQSVVLDGRDLRISDVRLSAATGQHFDPRYPVEEKNEPAFCALTNQLHLQKRKLHADARILFGCTMTSIAEWFRLSFEPSFDHLIEAMALLAKIAPSTITPGSPVELSIPANGGCWAGLRCQEPQTGHQFLEIRQFVSRENDDD
jgi:hypothetical protein